MKTREIERANGTGTTLYHRLEEGNDIVSTNINDNIYIGDKNSAPDNVDFIVDGNDIWFKVYIEKGLKKEARWQKMYLRGGNNG